MTQRHITEDLNLQEHHCDNLNIIPQILTSSLRLDLEGTMSTEIPQQCKIQEQNKLKSRSGKI